MYSLVFLALTSFLLGLVLTPLVRDAFVRAGCLDRPDDARKIHKRPVPRVGGIPIAISYLAAYALLLASPLNAGSLVAGHLPLVWKLLPAAALVFLTGLADDLLGLKPWQKLLGQSAAALAAWGAGVRILGIAGVAASDWWSLPLTAAWLVGCTNAFNLIDGMDGLAPGVGLFATLTAMAVALLHGNLALALATAPLAGALLAFLCYNFNPASIFLGDCGSLLVGFLLGCYSVLWSQKATTWLAMTAPLMALALPLVDVCLAVARRYLRRQPIFTADRGHIHHRLLDRGLTPRRAALLLYGVCSVGAALSVLQTVAHSGYAACVFALSGAVALAGVRYLGYVEFGVARRVLLGGTLRRILSEEIRLHHLGAAIGEAPTVHDAFTAIRDAAAGFGLASLEMSLLGEHYRTRAPGVAKPVWTIHIPLGDAGYVRCSGDATEPGGSSIAAGLAETVSKALAARLSDLRPTGSLDPSLVALARSVAAQGSANANRDEPAPAHTAWR